MDSARNLLQNIFFDIGMVINRHTSAEWRYIEKNLRITISCLYMTERAYL